MTIEELFVKDYQALKKENKALKKGIEKTYEKNAEEKAILQNLIKEKDILLCKLGHLIQDLNPQIKHLDSKKENCLWFQSQVFSGNIYAIIDTLKAIDVTVGGEDEPS